ncbi:MAG: LysM peptidoglycan-binding domain-containing protein [Selenomonadaceae bacterium]|nr:LysM peptidoglycan-binding domain-containing protein [Selenomonadaceae bacterium]
MTKLSIKTVNGKLKKFFAIAALVFFGAATASVQFTTDEPKYEVHVERYKVRSGDTFWDVSRYYRDLDDRNLYIFDYQDELRRLNPQLVENKNQLNVGDVIEVKYLKIKE